MNNCLEEIFPIFFRFLRDKKVYQFETPDFKTKKEVSDISNLSLIFPENFKKDTFFTCNTSRVERLAKLRSHGVIQLLSLIPSKALSYLSSSKYKATKVYLDRDILITTYNNKNPLGKKIL